MKLQRKFSCSQAGFYLTLIIAFIILSAMLGIFGLPKSSGDIEALYPRRSKALSDLRIIERLFGDRFVDCILIPISSPITDEDRENLQSLEDQLSGLESLSAIHSPLQALGSLPIPIRFLSPNKSWARFLLEIPSSLGDDEATLLHKDLERIRPSNSLRSGAFYATQVATKTVEEESEFQAPACALLIFAIILFWTRSIISSLKILIPPLFSVLALVVSLSVLNEPLGPIGQLVPPLLLAISTSYSVYLSSRLMQGSACQSFPPQSADLITDVPFDPLKGAFTGLALAAFTTIIGFLSLLFIDCRGVDQFAIIMSLSTGLSALLSGLLIPRLLKGEKATPKDANLTLSIALLSRPLYFLVSLLLVLSIGLLSLRVDTVPLDFFRSGSLELQNIYAAENIFPGSHVLSVAVEFDSPIAESDLSRLASLERNLRGISGVESVIGVTEFITLSRALKEKGLESSSMFGEKGPLSITSSDEKVTRVVLETDREGAALIELSKLVSRAIEDANLKARNLAISSRELVVAEQSQALTAGLLESAGSALVVVWLLLFIISRSFILSVVGLIPSALPILGIFGSLGLVLNSVNLGAALVAGCALGMISDFTFHMSTLKRTFGLSGTQAAQLCVKPFFLTGVSLVGEFSPTILSDVYPVRYFGLLFGAAIFLGIYLNLTLFPKLLDRFAHN